jgi:hypothetical protein
MCSPPGWIILKVDVWWPILGAVLKVYSSFAYIQFDRRRFSIRGDNSVQKIEIVHFSNPESRRRVITKLLGIFCELSLSRKTFMSKLHSELFWGNYRSTVVSIFKIITDLVSIFKIITDLVSILRLFLRVHSTGTTFEIYLEIDTTVNCGS